MRGFVSTISLILIVSLLVFQLSLSNKLYSSALSQKLSIDSMQRTNEKMYSMEDGFRKTARDANKDVQKRLLSISGKVITLSSGVDVNYLDEVYVCSKLNEWARENNYSLRVSLINPVDLSQKSINGNLFLKGKTFNSINSEVKKQSRGNLFLTSSFLCPAFIHSEGSHLKVELNKDLPLNPDYSSDFLPYPYTFVIQSNFLGKKLSVLIPEGSKL